MRNCVISASNLRVPALSFLLTGLLAACSHLPEMPSIASIKPYRIDIQQGNFLSQDMVSQLKRGMTREQVRFVLGTPLVTDVFHANRWDYVFYREVRGGQPEHRRLSVFFEDDKLVRVEGDVKPAGSEAAPANPAKGEKPGPADPKGAATKVEPKN